MPKETQLLEFLFELIDIQIKKYTFLTKIGIGPDAAMNAALVSDQVRELLGFADDLLLMLEKPQLGNSKNDKKFNLIFHQIRFYIEQEYIRGHAGWLLDENNIHTPEMKRLNRQRIQLIDLARAAAITVDTEFHPQTDTQLQCRHDSHAIAFYILDLALGFKSDPLIALPETIPAHARQIMLRHAQKNGRYTREDILEPMTKLHQQCVNFLANSPLKKSTAVLSREDAIYRRNFDKAELEHLLQRFRTLEPQSSIFSERHDWHNIGGRTATNISRQATHSTCRLFGSSAIIAALAICAVIFYVGGQDCPRLSFSP